MWQFEITYYMLDDIEMCVKSMDRMFNQSCIACLGFDHRCVWSLSNRWFDITQSIFDCMLEHVIWSAMYQIYDLMYWQKFDHIKYLIMSILTNLPSSSFDEMSFQNLCLMTLTWLICKIINWCNWNIWIPNVSNLCFIDQMFGATIWQPTFCRKRLKKFDFLENFGSPTLIESYMIQPCASSDVIAVPS